ncbi:FMN-binding glutamate synthase family protein [Oleiagrimonas soli]|uniref:Glutamate synthase n=1 Tax=Oleiagrimonas soli TaxID=1543381 RepID=A0A099CX59_9GAMM|nr:FMN-binding glutamate synthase family protein [Oleiagrimonas soli]KGI78227.1 glutamate synthase [Oleiagrimonas soli]MBB6183310.1 glutamate synthase domain-containing protein 2 [Oleiagrimonas soli]
MLRMTFYVLSLLALVAIAVLGVFHPGAYYFLLLVIPLIGIGLYDIFIARQNVLSNYPVIGHLRYIMEFISPEIRQYFLESDKSGRPYTRQQRGLIKARAHGSEAVHPFGTEYDVDESGYNLALHSLAVKKVPESAARVDIGGPQCTRPYNSSRLNISAMSFGALSNHAVLAMNKGAKLGGFAQDTGEGGLTPYHLEHGADVIWEIGSGYFGCRTKDGRFDDEQFRKKACQDPIKMIEIKLSQGAKPSHGGVLPGSKVNAEIAEIRGVPEGEDCVSPATHPEFDTPRGLLAFVERLRKLSDGRPVGFKLCVGRRSEFLSICKAMVETGITPDFVTVDGAEGGTGAAPVEYSDRLGLVIDEALPFVHNALTGCGLRDKIRIIASGKIVDGFDMAQKIALGADVCNVARPMMFAVGCIQAQRCHTNTCPTGVATQDARRARAINIDTRAVHVKQYHAATIRSFLDITGSLGAAHPSELHPEHFLQRLPDQTPRSYADMFPAPDNGALLRGEIPADFEKPWSRASAERF